MNQYDPTDKTTPQLRLLNARLRLELVAAGKWPPPPGWMVLAEDLEDTDSVTARLREARQTAAD
jgi:hypothetical protein